VDAQHVGLFDTAAKLADAIESGEGEHVVRSVLFTLLEYTRTHFAEEESLMKQVNYPAIEAHLLEHVYFIDTIRKWMDAPEQLNPDAVLAFIEGWLVGHITHSDAAYVPYILRDSERVLPKRRSDLGRTG
jgi:hemerythrin